MRWEQGRSGDWSFKQADCPFYVGRRMVKAASRMSKSNHKLMRLVGKIRTCQYGQRQGAKCRSVCEKYVYEYRVFGIKLHTFRNLEKDNLDCSGIGDGRNCGGILSIWTGRAGIPICSMDRNRCSDIVHGTYIER